MTMRPAKCFGLFSPAIVLAMWAIYIASTDERMTASVIIFWLVLLAISVVVSEILHVNKHRKIMKQVKRNRERDDR